MYVINVPGKISTLHKIFKLQNMALKQDVIRSLDSEL